MLTSESHQWHINLVKDRYSYLNLSDAQAESIHRYEEDKNFHSDKHFFSAWEEWDYELTIFREILLGDQLDLYERRNKEYVRQYEQTLIEADAEKTSENTYYEELIDFYETTFLPDFYLNPMLTFGWLSNDRTKVDYIKVEYKHFLNDRRKHIITEHFRHYRAFRPNELKASLLRHKLSYFFPGYLGFKHNIAQPTAAVVNYLWTRLRQIPSDTEKLLDRKFKELEEFKIASFKKHTGGELIGWHVVVEQLSPEEEKELRIMTALLIDKDKYQVRLQEI